MTKVGIFFYVMIIFLSQFHVALNVDGKPFYPFQIPLVTYYLIFYPF